MDWSANLVDADELPAKSRQVSELQPSAFKLPFRGLVRPSIDSSFFFQLVILFSSQQQRRHGLLYRRGIVR